MPSISRSRRTGRRPVRPSRPRRRCYRPGRKCRSRNQSGGAYGKEVDVEMVHDVCVLELIFFKPGVVVLLDFEHIVSLLVQQFVDFGKVLLLELDEGVA